MPVMLETTELVIYLLFSIQVDFPAANPISFSAADFQVSEFPHS